MNEIWLDFALPLHMTLLASTLKQYRMGNYSLREFLPALVFVWGSTWLAVKVGVGLSASPVLRGHTIRHRLGSAPDLCSCNENGVSEGKYQLEWPWQTRYLG